MVEPKFTLILQCVISHFYSRRIRTHFTLMRVSEVAWNVALFSDLMLLTDEKLDPVESDESEDLGRCQMRELALAGGPEGAPPTT